jgi:hypothetical protein
MCEHAINKKWEMRNDDHAKWVLYCNIIIATGTLTTFQDRCRKASVGQAPSPYMLLSDVHLLEDCVDPDPDPDPDPDTGPDPKWQQ